MLGTSTATRVLDPLPSDAVCAGVADASRGDLTDRPDISHIALSCDQLVPEGGAVSSI
jgi:hypothetical protein